MLTIYPALITISTRASLKRYHTYTLTLGLPPDSASPSSDSDAALGDAYTYSIQRIGTAAEKQSVEKELAELRERLSHVEEWKRRRAEIDEELKNVMVQGGESVPPPAYAEKEEAAAGDEVQEQVQAEEANGDIDGAADPRGDAGFGLTG